MLKMSKNRSATCFLTWEIWHWWGWYLRWWIRANHYVKTTECNRSSWVCNQNWTCQRLHWFTGFTSHKINWTFLHHNCSVKLSEKFERSSSSKWQYNFGDFVRNYTFIVQDEMPVVIHYWGSSSTKSYSLCFISYDLTHDLSFVYMVIKETVAFIRNFILSNLSKVHYFYNSCSG